VAFFASAVKFGANSLITNQNLVTKIYFPREILPLACVFANFFGFSLSLPYSSFADVIGRRLSVQFALDATHCRSAAFDHGERGRCAFLRRICFFRDVKYIVEVLFTYGILFTPVCTVPRFWKVAPALLLNPVASILEAINDVVVLQRGPALLAAYAAGGAVIGYCFW